MAGPHVPTRRWTRVEYDRLIEAGFFRPGDPVELLGGQMIVAEPQGSRHFAALRATQEALRAAFGAGWEIRGQGPIALDEESEPEPDLAVVPGTFRDYRAAHPSSPALVVEISEASLALDRAHKGSLCARAGLADYWIVNLPERCLEVYRDPSPTRPPHSGGDTTRSRSWSRAPPCHRSPGPIGASRSATSSPDPVSTSFQGFAPWWERKCARSLRSWSESPASSCDMAPP